MIRKKAPRVVKKEEDEQEDEQIDQRLSRMEERQELAQRSLDFIEQEMRVLTRGRTA